MTKGYITTCTGEEYELPALYEWEITWTGSVPCDSFSLRCPYEPAMADTLRAAVRFAAREDGETLLAGVIDEWSVECGKKGMQLSISGRGMAALLIDNEAESTSYELATTEDIIRSHVTPWGVTCRAWDRAEAAGYRVANGTSQWKAVRDFALLHGELEPHFDRDGTLTLLRTRQGAGLVIDDATAVTALRYTDRRYGVIAEALVVDSKAGQREHVRNEAFYARGGRSRRVFYVPARSGAGMMRCTGKYQIEQSQKDAETLTVTVAGRFEARPGDRARVSGTRLGVSGGFRVTEVTRRFDAKHGERNEVKMQRE